MTDDKLKEVLTRYEAKVIGMRQNGHLVHVCGMIPKVRNSLDVGQYDAAMHGLGFIQGVLWCSNVYSIDQLKDHNRPSDEAV